jgi:hypothetical protein
MRAKTCYIVTINGQSYLQKNGTIRDAVNGALIRDNGYGQGDLPLDIYAGQVSLLPKRKFTELAKAVGDPIRWERRPCANNCVEPRYYNSVNKAFYSYNQIAQDDFICRECRNKEVDKP